MKTLRVWSGRLPNISASALVAVPDQVAAQLLAAGTVKPADVLDGDTTAAPGVGFAGIRIWDPRLANLPPALLILPSAVIDILVAMGLVKAADVVAGGAQLQVGILDFSDPANSGLIL